MRLPSRPSEFASHLRTTRSAALLARSVRSQQRLFQTATWFTVWSSSAIVLAMSVVIGYGGIGSLVAFYGFITQLFEPLSGASALR